MNRFPPRRLEVIDAKECRRLLATASVGRIAVNRRGHGPLVVPVSYVVDASGTIVFRTDAGAKLAAIARGAVSFQVDELDHERRVGWSVLVDGLAHEADADDEVAAAVAPWASRPLRHAVRIVPTSMAGRRIVEDELGPEAGSFDPGR